MITKERIGHELYVYFNGSLIYKRWITTSPSGEVLHSYGRVFPQYGGY